MSSDDRDTDDGAFRRTGSSDGVAMLQVTAFRSGGACYTCTNDVRQMIFGQDGHPAACKIPAEGRSASPDFLTLDIPSAILRGS
jgi:hypothetical protein